MCLIAVIIVGVGSLGELALYVGVIVSTLLCQQRLWCASW